MAKKKMINCKSCEAEIAASAKVCPHCGVKNKKPFFQKAWFWIVAVLLILALASGGDEPEADGEFSVQENTVKTEETTTAPQPVQTEYRVGESLVVDDLKVTYVASGVYTSDNQYLQPAEGNKFIFLKFAFENLSGQTDKTASLHEFECYADGYNAEMKYFDEESLSATLSAGRAVSGCIYFEIPEEAVEVEIEYTENVFTNMKYTFLYEGEQDSGYVLTGSNVPNPNAIQVGSSAESKKLKITYLNCYQDSSGNQFIQPKEGYRFITCEFEFENLAETDFTVSSFSFDCYADGISCEGSYFRDDNLSATLSSGRKAKGTVTFEVPLDAEVLEVEYLSNVWTSNRVVFNAKPQ